jgi:hypothetical protein
MLTVINRGGAYIMEEDSESQKINKSSKSSEVWNLTLYVSGQTPKSIEVFAN